MASPTATTAIALGTFVVGDDSPLHALIRRFRAGDEAAYRVALDAAARALAVRRDAVPGTSLLVAVPSHSPAGPRRPLDGLVSDLAARGGWVAPAEPPLRRIFGVPQAKLGRTDHASLAASLQWAPPRHAGPIILVDDVIRTGGTIAACVAAMRVADPSATVALVLGLARATHRGDGPPTPNAG